MQKIQQQIFPQFDFTIKRRLNRKMYNQYFTPNFAVESVYNLLSGEHFQTIIDPAVGEGIFLKHASKRWKSAQLLGIDFDKKMVKELKKRKFSNSSFYCFNSLNYEFWQKYADLKKEISNGGFELVVGNPPFSSWFDRIEDKKLLSTYELAHREGRIRKSQAIEILFLELFIKLAKQGGFVIIVLPDGILSNPQYEYARRYILINTDVKFIISLRRNVFEQTSAKTSILLLKKKIVKNTEESSTTKLLELDDNRVLSNQIEVCKNDLIRRMDFEYYRRLIVSDIEKLKKKGIIFRPLEDFIIYFKTGKTLYGSKRKFSINGLRFLHATNITEIGINYKKDQRYILPFSEMDFLSAHVHKGDILFVRVGVGCAGRTGIVDVKEDEGIATDYIHIFRVKDINPYFLVVYLKTKYGKETINLLKHGVGTVSINKTDLLSIPIPIVSERIQLEVEKRYRNVLHKYRKNSDSNEALDRIRSLILNLEEKLMNISREVINA